MKKTLTLQEFCDREGSQEKAAQAIGTTLNTVGRWLAGTSHPRSEIIKKRLVELGISLTHIER